MGLDSLDVLPVAETCPRDKNPIGLISGASPRSFAEIAHDPGYIRRPRSGVHGLVSRREARQGHSTFDIDTDESHVKADPSSEVMVSDSDFGCL